MVGLVNGRSTLAAALVAGSCFLSSGCALGTVSRFDGEWPIAPAPKDQEPQYTDVGSGQGGALLIERGKGARYRIVEPGHEATFESTEPLDGAVLDGDDLYVAGKTGVEKRRRSGESLGAPETVLALEGTRRFAVAPLEGGKVLAAAANDRGVLLAVPGHEPTLVFEGHALALALDAANGVLWVASDRPLGVIDCVSVESRATLLRTPLPTELATPGLRLVASGESAVAYAVDRPIEQGLLIARAAKEALPLLRIWNADEAHRGRTVADSEPPLALPPGHEGPAGFELAGTWQRQGPGRVVAFPGGRFLVADARNPTASLAVFTPPSSAGSPPSLRTVPIPGAWPGVVQGLGSDAHGAVVTAGQQKLALAPDSLDPTLPGESLSARRFFNYAINGVIATGEVAVSIPFGELRGALLCPFGVIGCLLFPGETSFYLATAPFWSPFAQSL